MSMFISFAVSGRSDRFLGPMYQLYPDVWLVNLRFCYLESHVWLVKSPFHSSNLHTCRFISGSFHHVASVFDRFSD